MALGKSFHHFVDSFFICKIKILSVQHCHNIYLPIPVSPTNLYTLQEQRYLLIYQSKPCSQILPGHRPSMGRNGMPKACAGLSFHSFSQNRVGGVFLDAWGVAQPGQPGQRGEVGTAKQMSSQMPGKSEGHRKNPGQESGNLVFVWGLSTTPCISLGKSLNIPTEAL